MGVSRRRHVAGCQVARSRVAERPLATELGSSGLRYRMRPIDTQYGKSPPSSKQLARIATYR